MSAAHRPTWEPARAKADVSHISQSFSKHSLPSQTRLKFRRPGDVQRRSVQELKAELEEKERQAAAVRNPERAEAEADGGDAKRRKLPQEAEALDADEPEAESSKPDDDARTKRYVERLAINADGASGAEDGAKDDEDEDEDEEDEEDEKDDDDYDDDTETLLRELEKIKQERAAERERQELRDHAQEQLTREEEIARGNPLLNLEKAIHGDSTPASGAALGAPQKRWDEDLIFRNQAAGSSNLAERGFVNDLTRTEFHKKFMNVCTASGKRPPLTEQRYIK